MKMGIRMAGAAFICATLLQMNTYADVIDISGAPGEPVVDAVITKSDIIEIGGGASSGGTISGEPQSVYKDPSGNPVVELTNQDGPTGAMSGGAMSGGAVSGGDMSGPIGPGAGLPGGGSGSFGPSGEMGPAGTGSQQEPGSYYKNAPGTEVPLPFKLVMPNVPKGKHRVAEGSVQLSDGSWDMIGYDRILRGPYYRVLKEVTDYSGVPWYVCDVSASSIGAYKTPDGSKAEELWLKKSDCTELSSIYLNTTNQTRINIVVEALANLGDGYASGAGGEDSFDCSGLVNYVYKKAGLKIPRQSSAICAMPGQISIDMLRPGDIVGRPGHVGVYIADGIFIHASERSTGVVAEYLGNYNNAIGFSNYINAVGD